ncbi:asparaginase [bacterium]|nr:asparaginase [bacterium]
MNFFAKSALAASLFCTMLAGSAPAYSEELPRVLILATGGTIAGVAKENSATGYDAGKIKAEDLVNAVPQISKLANCDVEQFCNIASQDMTCDLWVRLSKRVNDALTKQHYDGVVITHGSDTMEETAFFLENTVERDNPVVFVGSMRPATAISPDGPANLYYAVKIASAPESHNRGVLVTMCGNIFESRDIYKSNINSLDPYSSRYNGPVGRVDEGAVRYYSAPIYGERPYWGLPADAVLPKVDIVHAYAGYDGDSIDAAVEHGARGIVIAGVGNGNMSKECIEAVKRAVSKGVKVVRSSRVVSGFVHRNHEVSDDELGTLASYDLSPEHARILLQLLIYHLDNGPRQNYQLDLQKCFENGYFVKH